MSATPVDTYSASSVAGLEDAEGDFRPDGRKDLHSRTGPAADQDAPWRSRIVSGGALSDRATRLARRRLRQERRAGSAKVHITVVGDSHAKFFRITPQMINVAPELERVGLALHVIRAATIKGFGRRASTLGTRERIARALERPADYVLLNFGQVDVELGYYYRRAVKGDGVDFEPFTRDLLDTYMDTIGPLAAAHPVAVKGINLSVLGYDGEKALQYTHRIVTENIADAAVASAAADRLRRALPSAQVLGEHHRLFNRELATRCADRGIFYYDVNDVIGDPVTGNIRMEYVPEEFDHHLAGTLATHLAYWRPLLAHIGQT